MRRRLNWPWAKRGVASPSENNAPEVEDEAEAAAVEPPAAAVEPEPAPEPYAVQVPRIEGRESAVLTFYPKRDGMVRVFNVDIRIDSLACVWAATFGAEAVTFSEDGIHIAMPREHAALGSLPALKAFGDGSVAVYLTGPMAGYMAA